MNLIICDNDGMQNLLPMTSLATTTWAGKNTEMSMNNLIHNITMIIPDDLNETLTQPQQESYRWHIVTEVYRL